MEQIADDWLTLTGSGYTVAVTATTNQHVDTLNQAVQQARLDAGRLDPTTATVIAGGEHAHVGEIVVTRRNDRHLTTSHGDTVHNRDTWTVVATHPDGSLTVTKPDGPAGRSTLPPDYVAEHVRLGYAATEHGHQGDTVDVGIALTSAATTHRGLYVAATRGRDDNRIHVITDHDDLTEARDILDGVLTHDRADIPAMAQRRHLAQIDGPTERLHPETPVPDWIELWRQQLHDQRQLLVDGIDLRQEQRASALRELRDLQPVLDAARRAWEPYAQPIRHLEVQLQTQLRPAAGQADRDARKAGLTRRRGAQSHAADAAEAVHRAEAQVAAIHTRGAPIKEHLDTLEQRAAALQAQVEPSDGIDTYHRHEIIQLDQILDAADIYTSWLEGQPTPPARVTHAITTLSGVARHAPFFAQPGQPDRTQWHHLLDLAPDNLQQLKHRPPLRELDLGR